MDDGSTDGTGAMIAERYGDDPRVRYHYRSNGGVSAARNAAMELARGSVLVFCDSDDVWNADKLALQMVTFARYPEVGLVWTDVSAVDAAGTMLHERFTRICYPAWQTQPIDTLFARSEAIPGGAGGRVYVGEVFPTMIAGTLINMPSVAIRTELARRIGTFDETMRTGEDYDFVLRACGAGPVAFIDVPTVLYRIGAPDQLTRPSLFADQARNWFRTFSRVRDAARAAGFSDRHLRPILRGKYQWLGMAELECGERRAGRAALWSAVRSGSRSPRVWMTLLGTLLPASFERSLRALLRTVKSRVGARKATV